LVRESNEQRVQIFFSTGERKTESVNPGEGKTIIGRVIAADEMN